MSSKHSSSKAANVKLVQNRKPLARAIALALMMGCVAVPATTFAALIQGKVFNDVGGDGNPTPDASDTPRVNTTVFIRDDYLANLGQGGITTVTTNSQGDYTFNTPRLGSFTLYVSLPYGSTQTTPVRGTGMVRHTINVGESGATVNFGVFSGGAAPLVNTSPTASIGSLPTSVVMGQTINFNGSYTDPDTGQTHTFEWNFGDGATASSQNASHTYTSSGPRNVTFKVTDNLGGTQTAQRTINVQLPAFYTPVVQSVQGPSIVVAGQQAQFSASFTGASGDYTCTWVITQDGVEVGRYSVPASGSGTVTVTQGHPFSNAGNVTVTMTVEDTVMVTTGTSQPLNLTVTAANADVCERPTIRSSTSGSWDVAGTWVEGRVPNSTDVVLVNQRHTVTLPPNTGTTPIEVAGLCVEQQATLQSHPNTGGATPAVNWVNINAWDNIHNKGTIQGWYGVDGFGIDTNSNSQIEITEYHYPTEGSGIYLSAAKFVNDGQIGGGITGRGGDDYPYLYLQAYTWKYPLNGKEAIEGGRGGKAEIYAQVVENHASASIEGGHGGNGFGTKPTFYNSDGTPQNNYGESNRYLIGNVKGNAKGGNGGNVELTAIAENASEFSNNQGVIRGGCGGSAYAWWYDTTSTAGIGGSASAWVPSNSGQIAMPGNLSTQGCTGGAAYWEPITLKATSTTRIEDYERVVIYGPEDATIDLRELSEGAISAQTTITIAAGKNGTVDLRGLNSKVFKAGTLLEVFADNLLLDAGVTLENLADAPTITTAPSKTIYKASWSSHGSVIGNEANATLPVTLTLNNESAGEDTYAISVSDPAGRVVGTLPSTVTAKYMERSKLTFDVTLPATRGTTEVVTITATSQNDPTVKAVTELQVGVLADEVITPRNGQKADVTFIVDNSEIIGGETLVVSNALEKYLADSQGAINTPFVELITFNDKDVVSRVVTKNVGDVIGRMRSIRPTGHSCTNLSVAALESALSNVNTNGQIVLVTAASAEKQATEVVNKLREQGIKVHVVLTGSCNGNQDADQAFYKDIADATGGTFNWQPRGNITDAVAIEKVLTETVIPATMPEPIIPNSVASGQVLDNQGQPVAGVTLKVGDKTVTTDATGAFKIGELVNGDYTVTANKDGYTIEAKHFTVKDGNVTVDMVATLNTYTASGKVFAEVKPILLPLKDATVQIGDQTAVTDKLGYWKIDGLTNGTYTATATKNGHTIPSQQVVINGEDLTFDFGVVYTAYGTLKNDQKQPVAGVTITIGDKHTQTDATGFWKLDGLPAGESTLIASQDGYKFAPEKFVLGDQEPNKEILVTPASTLVLKAKPTPWQAIRQGENVTYTYTLFNGGTQTATGVTFTETVPPGAKLVSLKTLNGGDCQADTLTCTLPDLTVGATTQVEVVLQAIDGNSFKNTATATATEYPADVQTHYKTVKPHLSVTVTDNHDPVEMLTDLRYTATVELSPLAPVDTAKDINLVMQLPKGLELKAVTSPDGTTCDSNQFPLVTCQLPDLSIASPTQTSQTEVNVDVTLKDAGLLVLMNEAKVTASNYPTHTVRERTNIFIPDHIKIDLVMVIDTTNSMAPEINGVKAAIDKLIATVPAGQRPTMALVEFKDDVRVKAFTQDTEVMLGAVAKLVAEGGGTCPEASVEALEVALKHLKDGGTILLATDASPYPEANLEDLVKRIQSGNMTFNAIISGDCTGEGDVNEMTK